MDLGLRDKAVIVTGGASNIGRAISLAFAAEGAKVAIVDIDEEQAQKVASKATELGASQVLVSRTDVSNWDEVRAMASKVEDEFGQVDILVNNVGWTVEKLFVDKPREEWEREIQLNLWSVINCTRAVLDGMIERKSGSVVSIGSDAGRVGEFREAVYAACKAGVMALSKTLVHEYGRHNIRFNVVCPGTTMPESDDDVGGHSLWNTEEFKNWNTPEMREKIAKAYPMRRVGAPGDVARAVAFLSSDAASFIAGQTLSVSGGYTMA